MLQPWVNKYFHGYLSKVHDSSEYQVCNATKHINFDFYRSMDYIYISDLWYYQFQPFVVLSGNCIYIGFSKHPIYIFINFVSLLVLVVLLLSVLRVLCLSLMVALIYSGAVLITFIFVVMTFDQSDILCIPSYKFIPLLVLYIEGFIPQVAYEI